MQRQFFEPALCTSTGQVEAICGSFPYAEQEGWRMLRRVLFYLPFIAAFYLIWKLISALQHHGATYDRDGVHRILVLLGTLALGPVLLVNVFLKAFSGRPRPFQTELFGGEMPFVPAGAFHGICQSNCSFVSGEAAGGSWLLCFILFLPAPLQRAIFPAVAVLSIMGASMRIAFGRHFLSDVALGWLSTLVIFIALCAIYGWPLSPKSRDGRK